MNICTKNDYIYETMRNDIVDGHLRPGERIIISDLAQKYNVSPMPIREAINRLQQDGFVEVVPHVGARVSHINVKEFEEILLIRAELEPLACKLSTPYVTQEQIGKLEELIAEMKICLDKNDGKGFGRLNHDFHMMIYTAGPHKILQSLIVNLWQRSEFSRNIFSVGQDRNQRSHGEHIACLEAIKNKDAEKAAEIMRKQKLESFGEYMKLLEEE